MTRLTLLLPLVLIAALQLPLGSARAAEAIPLPSKDPFYAYAAGPGLAAKPAGTVLRQREVETKVLASIPVRSTQLLYRTSDELGRPSTTVTTVIAPLGAVTGLVGYLSFYDALGEQCSPSYTFRGGDAGTQANNQQALIETTLVAGLLAQGFAVTVPDFQGKDLHWVAGHESGKSALDAVRATQSFLKLPAGSKVGLYGYSGGSIAGEWAAELAPTYAPELNIVGAAIGGMPIHLGNNLTYVDGSQTWSGVIPAAVVALSRAFGVDLDRYLSAYGKKVATEVSDQCIGSFNGNYPGLTVKQMMKPQYADFLHIPKITRMVNSLIMGSVPGAPKTPLFMLVGNGDGIGDDVMIVKDTQSLARQYCDQGVKVNLQVVPGAAHTAAGVAFFAQAGAWLAGRMLGAPMIDNCSSIPAERTLAPIALKRLAIAPTLTVTNKAPKRDLLRVRVGVDAAGAQVSFFRMTKKGKRISLGSATVASSGVAAKAVKDRNGRAKTRYVAVVAAGPDTVGGRTASVAHR